MSPRNFSSPSASAEQSASCGSFCAALRDVRLRKHGFYFLLVLFAAFTIYDLQKIVREYVNENKNTDMFVVFNDTMTSPNITFCMFKPQAWSHFKNWKNDSEIDDTVQEGLKRMTSKEDFLKEHWDDFMVIDAYLVISSLNSMERETSAESLLRTVHVLAHHPRKASVRASLKKWLSAIAERGVSFEEFQQKVGYETLKRSLQRFQRLSNTEDGSQVQNSVKITWISQRQLCFQPLYDKDNFKDIEDQDQFFTMSVVHGKNMAELKCMTVDFHGRPSEEARYLQGKGRTKDGYFEDLCLGYLHELEVEVKEIFTSLPDADEKERKCLNYEDGDKSELDCRSRCRMELIRKVCGCSAHTMGYLVDPADLKQFGPCDYTQCQIKPEHVNLSSNWDDECGKQCYPDCTQLRYRIHNNPKVAQRDELTQVTLYWGSFEYLRLIQKQKWSVSKFMSNLGGSMGVWLGLSVLSIVQFIVFLMAQLHKKMNNQQKDGSAEEANGNQQTRRKSTTNNPLGGGDISMNPFGGGAKGKKH